LLLVEILVRLGLGFIGGDCWELVVDGDVVVVFEGQFASVVHAHVDYRLLDKAGTGTGQGLDW
jgi:hypothetical protein